MTKEEVGRCTSLAKKCLTQTGKKQELARNELYLSLQPHMIKWMQAIMAKKNAYLEQGDLLSESWFCFEFCLRHFKPEQDIPLPNHFYSYSKFYIVAMQNERIRQNSFNAEFKEDCDYVSLKQEDLNSVYEQLDELQCFRASLPKDYHSIFDDATMSMVGCLNDRVRRLDETPVTYYRYCESKKIFRIVIDYLLRR